MPEAYTTHPGWVAALTISNAVAFLAAYRFWKYMWYEMAIVLVSSGLVSTVYHISDSLDRDIIISEGGWAIADFWLAFSSMNVIAVYIAKWGRRYRSGYYMMLLSLLIITLLLILWNKTGTGTILVNAGIILGILVIKFTFIDKGIPKGLDWRDLLVSMLVAGAGITFYAVASSKGSNDPSVYWWTHSIWHITVYGAAALIIDVYNPYRVAYFWRKEKGGDEKWRFVIWTSSPELYYPNPYVNDVYLEETLFRRAYVPDTTMDIVLPEYAVGHSITQAERIRLLTPSVWNDKS